MNCFESPIKILFCHPLKFLKRSLPSLHTNKKKFFLANCENTLQRQMSYTQVRQETFSDIYKYIACTTTTKNAQKTSIFFAEICIDVIILKCFPKYNWGA